MFVTIENLKEEHFVYPISMIKLLKYNDNYCANVEYNDHKNNITISHEEYHRIQNIQKQENQLEIN